MGLFSSTKADPALAVAFAAKVSRNDLHKQEPAEKPEQAAPEEPQQSPEDVAEPEQTESEPKLDEKTKNLQTVFVGNVNNSVITSKPAFKQFKKLLREYGDVGSIRFRSIAFSELMPRKAAFIKQKLHPSRDAVNAYVVYQSQEAAEGAAAKLNGVEFLDHHLRADSLAKPTPHIRKKSVFIGNLDFEAAEEPLYRHFQKCGPIEYVRIVRDATTNVGKGFAYVQFKDPAAVDLALMMDGADFNGRRLRVSRAAVKTKVSGKKAEPRKKNGEKRTRKPRISPGEVLEGERAKEGNVQDLSTRKRKARHKDSQRKRARASK